MNISGLSKVAEAIGEAFSVFDFSFFISGAATLGFVALDLHYYGHDGILHLTGWISILVYLVAIYICGLMSWSVGKLMRWGLLKLLWGSNGMKEDFDSIFENTKNDYDNNIGHDSQEEENTDRSYGVNYTSMWIKIEKQPQLASKLSSLNKMWIMVAVFEGLACSWLVGLLVYLDGVLIGKWIKTDVLFYKFIPPLVLLIFIGVSLHRATTYSRDLIKEVVITYYNI